MRLDSGSEPERPASHMSTGVNNRYSTVYGVASVFWILCLVFLHPIMSTKYSAVSPVSGERERKVITSEIKLKITAQLCKCPEHA